MQSAVKMIPKRTSSPNSVKNIRIADFSKFRILSFIGFHFILNRLLQVYKLTYQDGPNKIL